MKTTYPTGRIDWMLRQDAYTLQRPERKRFPRNPYIVNNVGDLRKLDVADISSLTSQNDRNKYLLNAIETFSKYAYSAPIRSKAGVTVVSGFRSILASTSGRRLLVLRTEKGKDFL